MYFFENSFGMFEAVIPLRFFFSETASRIFLKNPSKRRILPNIISGIPPLDFFGICPGKTSRMSAKIFS